MLPSKVSSVFLRAAPYICLTLLFIPIIAGIVGSLLPALGYFPALGSTDFSFQYFIKFLESPAIRASIFLSIWIGITATILSFFIAFFILVAFFENRGLKAVRSSCIPLIALPHSALCIALVFLLVPSGFLARVFSPWLTGWKRPLDFLIAQDPWGISMIFSLICKETPFLVLIMLAALSQIKVHKILTAFRSMGYYKLTIWLKCILPQIYRSIRLPLYAILVFSVSVVDVALIIGPQIPPPLAVRIVEWFNHPADLNYKLSASAASLFLLFLCILLILLWELAIKGISFFTRRFLSNGNRGKKWKISFTCFRSFIRVLNLSILVGFFGLFLWSFARVWRFPSIFPTQWTTRNWLRGADLLLELFYNSLFIGATVSFISIVLVILCLERELLGFKKNRPKKFSSRGLFLIYIPLLIPQLSTMFGFQIFLAKLNWEGNLWIVLWSHLIFVLPYCFLALADTYRSFENRYKFVALGLGVSPLKFFWKVKFILLLEPILLVFAIGFSVSIALYIPTLFAGAGRINTITTEAVSLSSGANRKTIGVYAILQMLLPYLVLSSVFFFKNLPFYWKRFYYFLRPLKL